MLILKKGYPRKWEISCIKKVPNQRLRTLKNQFYLILIFSVYRPKILDGTGLSNQVWFEDPEDSAQPWKLG